MSIESKQLEENIERNKNDIEISFLNRWSILSGGTFSLLIPLLQYLKDNCIIFNKNIFIFSEIFILLSLVSSLVGLFAIRECNKEVSFIYYIFHLKKINTANNKSRSTFFVIKEWSTIVAVVSYIVGIIFIIIFINSSIL